MLSDRPTMREEYRQERTSALTWLISAMVAGFVLQLLMGASWIRGGNRFEEVLGLTTDGLSHGWFWTLLTHAFLHSTTFIVHVLVNVLALFFLGRELLPMLGSKRFLGLFGAATVVSGAVWTALHWGGGAEMHLGATAAIEAMFVVFACFFPNQETRFLVLFFPVTLKPKHVAYALAAAGLIGFFCYELPGNTLPFELTFSSSAHLAGMLTGYVYYRFVHDGRWFRSEDSTEIALPRWMQSLRKPAAPPASEMIDVPPPPMTREGIRAEVDRILDKINSQGFGALTPEERRVLDEARDVLPRH